MTHRAFRPNVAGYFYPAEREKLINYVNQFSQPLRQNQPLPKIIISPHAGFQYSGAVAGQGYSVLLKLKDIVKRVVLLGPSHHYRLTHIAAPSVEAFATPLGNIPVDKKAIEEIVKMPQVEVIDTAFKSEHCLEVQFPFLQLLLDDFSIVPLLVGHADIREVTAVIEKLWGGDETLFIISTDLSHYHDYETARKMDTQTANAIINLTPDKIKDNQACGAYPLRAALEVAKKHHLHVETIAMCNSGDTAAGKKNKERVVGYGAYHLLADDMNKLTKNEKDILLKQARHSIRYGLSHQSVMPINLAEYSHTLRQNEATFVTLHINRKLRGCRGNLVPNKPLIESVVANAYAAAFDDPRFSELTTDEELEVDLSISLLSPMKPITVKSQKDLIKQVRVGIDGLLLVGEKGKQGTFLPSVWQSFKEPEEFINQLKIKAGYTEKDWSDNWKFFRYQAEEIS